MIFKSARRNRWRAFIAMVLGLFLAMVAVQPANAAAESFKTTQTEEFATAMFSTFICGGTYNESISTGRYSDGTPFIAYNLDYTDCATGQAHSLYGTTTETQPTTTYSFTPTLVHVVGTITVHDFMTDEDSEMFFDETFTATGQVTKFQRTFKEVSPGGQVSKMITKGVSYRADASGTVTISASAFPGGRIETSTTTTHSVSK